MSGRQSPKKVERKPSGSSSGLKKGKEVAPKAEPYGIQYYHDELPTLTHWNTGIIFPNLPNSEGNNAFVLCDIVVTRNAVPQNIMQQPNNMPKIFKKRPSDSKLNSMVNFLHGRQGKHYFQYGEFWKIWTTTDAKDKMGGWAVFWGKCIEKKIFSLEEFIPEYRKQPEMKEMENMLKFTEDMNKVTIADETPSKKRRASRSSSSGSAGPSGARKLRIQPKRRRPNDKKST